MNLLKKYACKISFVLLLFFMFSCNIGLGEAIDLEAPKLTVITPERNAIVTQVVKVSGTAYDDESVKTILISIEETNQEFKWESNCWYENINNSWTEYANANSSVEDKTVTWDIDVPIREALTANTYTLVIKATDEMGNEGALSKDERAITVDIKEPEVSITYPVVTNGYEAALNKSNSYSLKDNNCLQELVNQDILVSGYQREDCKLDKLLVFIDDATTVNLPGIDKEIDSYIFKKEITGTGLRNWSFIVLSSELPAKYKTGKHLLRLVTESHDTAGNIERKVQGWFTYWNEADRPWVSAEFGYEPGKTVEENVYPSCALQGQAYDDDGLRDIFVDVYKKDPVTQEYSIKIENKCIHENLVSLNCPTFYNWTVYALAEACDFKIIARCIDKNGLESAESVERFMKVSDVNPPIITVTSSTENSLFGDASGNFTIEGYVIDDDKDKIPSLTLVWIKNEQNLANYVNPGYGGWTADTNGDKHYTIVLPSADPEKPQYYGKFGKSLNLFNDLGISANDGGNTLKTQNFALLSVDDGGQTATSFISFAGDYEKPELTIDSVTVDSTSYIFNDPTRRGNLNLPPFARDSEGNITSKVKLSGTWKDNSTEIWSKDNLLKKIGKVNVTWTGYGTDGKLSVNMKENGTWETVLITPPDSSTASVTAELVDIGKNIATVNECFNININKPELIRITADADGYYKAGSTINVKLEFNKEVTFSGGSSNPLLKFNNTEVMAEYASGNGSAVHVYTYTVVQGHNFNPLDVTSIVANGNVWKDEKETAIDNVDIPVENANKLKGNKKIVVDTIPPTISEVKAISSNGSYKKDATLFFTVKFSEDIAFTKRQDIKLKFDKNIEVGNPAQVGPDTLMFTYTVAENQNANPLSLKSVYFGDCVTKDLAQNELALETDKDVKYETSPIAGIIIDTDKPKIPVINITGASGAGEVLYESSLEFEIDYYDEKEVNGTKKKYSTDDGVTYKDYTDKVTITTNGTYKIKAYQEDTAGNKSEYSAVKTVTLDSGNILTNVTSTNPNGTYTNKSEDEGKIFFVLSFRKPVDASATSLLLEDRSNPTNEKFKDKTATYISSSADKKTIKYSYTIVDGDSCLQLNVKEISGVLKDTQTTPATILSSYYVMPVGYSFTDNRSAIKIVTGKPKLKTENGFVFDGKNKITLTFDRKVSKGTGNITITQNETKSPYLVPAVLTQSEYDLISGISDYYDEGTNGSDADGKLDLTKKYILNYEYDIDNQTIVKKFKDSGSFTRVIDVGSNNVVRKNDYTFEVTLSDNSLEVKGAYYNCTIDEGCFIDDLNAGNKIDLNREMFIKGVCKPTIRVQKASGKATWDATQNKVVVTEPLTANVKVDCRTPKVSLNYALKTSVQNTKVFSNTNRPGTGNYNYTNGTPTSDKTNYDSNNKYKTVTTSIGDDEPTHGYSAIITATASVNSDLNPNASASSSETANRTSFIMLDTYGGTGNDKIGTDDSNYNYMWIRGGDSPSGGVVTPGFPLSWKSEQLNKICAMTKHNNNWTWVSWELSVPTYVHFLRGNTPLSEDHTKNGPETWCWAGQGFVLHVEDYPVYPGDTLSFEDGDSGYNLALCFYKKHCEYRTGTTVTKSQKQ